MAPPIAPPPSHQRQQGWNLSLQASSMTPLGNGPACSEVNGVVEHQWKIFDAFFDGRLGFGQSLNLGWIGCGFLVSPAFNHASIFRWKMDDLRSLSFSAGTTFFHFTENGYSALGDLRLLLNLPDGFSVGMGVGVPMGLPHTQNEGLAPGLLAVIRYTLL